MPRKNSRTANGSGTIRKRSDGRWEGRASLGRDPLTGKLIRKSIFGATEGEVRKKLTAMTAAVDDGTYTEPSKLTVSQWIDVWAAEYLGDIKPNTATEYQSVCKTHLKPALGAVKLTALSTHTIQTLYNRLHRDAGLSAKTIKNINGVLHKCLQQAVELRYIRFNPASSTKLPRIEKTPVKPLNTEEMDAFIKAISGHRWKNLFTVALFTGMREGEVLGVTWSRVDFGSGSILIDRQLQKIRATGEVKLVEPKNSKSRRITPAPFVMEALKDQRRQQAEWKLKAGKAWSNEQDLVFTNEIGHYLPFQTVYHNYKRIADSIGVQASTFHTLRHTYAVTALQAGDSAKDVQEALGHHTAAFTLDVYGHVTEEMKIESAARMEQFAKSKGLS